MCVQLPLRSEVVYGAKGDPVRHVSGHSTFIMHDPGGNRVWSYTYINFSSYLIEEHVLPVGSFSGKLLNNPLWTDAMLRTQLLPKLKTN